MAETIVLDPAAVATNRTQLDITSWVAATGPDWGDAELEAYKASLKIGEVRLEYRLPNRLIKIPLILKALGGTTFSSIRLQIQAKVGVLQREGGWIMRQVGSTPLYADVQSATLHLGGSWLQAYRSADIDAVLAVECLPDWYGAEVTLDTLTATGVLFAKLQKSSADAVIAGNYPGRVRIAYHETGAHDQKGLLWGFRSRHYDGTATAALFYEAETMTGVNGAAGTALSGASGGTAVQINSPPQATWVPMLSTALSSGTVLLTHQGSYRVWIRAYSPNDTTQFRLAWGPNDLAVPVTNDAAQISVPGQFCLLDLGQIRIDAPPVGSNAWQGVISAYSNGTAGTADIDAVYFQPLDETAGKLAYTAVAPASAIYATSVAGSAVDDSSTGTLAWTDTSNSTNLIAGIVAQENSNAALTYTRAKASSSAVTSHYLKTTAFGFSILAGATIQGIQVNVWRKANSTGTPFTRDNAVRLVKAGTIQATDRSNAANWPTTYSLQTYGGPTDLWGGSWSPSDINNSGFGFAISVNDGALGEGRIDYITVTVYYTLAGGFFVGQDAVVYAGGFAEFRTEGMYRQGTVSPTYALVSNVIGDLPRIPPSGLEGRPVELFLKPTRGDFDTLADSSLDGMQAIVYYRPSFLFVGE